MAPLATVAMIAGTGIQAYGQYQAGQAAMAQAEMEQEIANQNAKLKERQAAAERARAYEEARQFQREGEAFQASQQVNLAKGGVLTSAGTPVVVLEDTARELEADRKAILREGFLAESYRLSEAENLRYQGRAAIARGKNQRTAYRYQALGSILTGGYQAYQSWPTKTPTLSKTAKATIARY